MIVLWPLITRLKPDRSPFLDAMLDKKQKPGKTLITAKQAYQQKKVTAEDLYIESMEQADK